jgi:hypothetical protein
MPSVRSQEAYGRKRKSDTVNLFGTDAGIFKAEPGRMIRPFISGMFFPYKTLLFSGGGKSAVNKQGC